MKEKKTPVEEERKYVYTRDMRKPIGKGKEVKIAELEKSHAASQ